MLRLNGFFLNRFNEFHDSITIGFGKLVELLGGSVGIALLGVAVPHDGFDDGACAAVVQISSIKLQKKTLLDLKYQKMIFQILL